MKPEHDPTLVFDEHAISREDCAEVRVLRTPEGYTLLIGPGSPIFDVLKTLEQALVQGYTLHLVIP